MNDNGLYPNKFASDDFSDCDSTVATFESSDCGSAALSVESSRIGNDNDTSTTTANNNNNNNNKKRRRVRFVESADNKFHPHIARSSLSRKERERCYYKSFEFCKMRMDATTTADIVCNDLAMLHCRIGQSTSSNNNNNNNFFLLTEELRGMEQFTTLGKDQFLYNRMMSHGAMVDGYRKHPNIHNNKKKKNKTKNVRQLEATLARLYGQACEASVLEAQQRGQLDAWIVYGDAVEYPSFLTTKNNKKNKENSNNNNNKKRGVGSKLRKLFSKRQ